MTDLETMLSDAGRSHSSEPAVDGVVDADITRGRRALARRRLRQGGSRLAVVVALIAGAFVVVQPDDNDTQPRVAAPSSSSGVATPSIQLVAYTGKQPDGYTVGTVPDGWEIQGVTNFVLVIARKGDPDKSIDSFVGKLVVMLQSKDEKDRTDGKKVKVGASTGVIVRGDGEMAPDGTTTGDQDMASLFFGDSAGHRLLVQVPPELHWTDSQILEFGASVKANANAEAGVG